MRIASAGHAVFAVTLIALGVVGLANPDVTTIWDSVPKGMPAREGLRHLCAFVSLGCGAGLLWKRTAALAARVLLACLLMWMLVFKLRFIVLQPGVELSYQSCGVTAVPLAAAWILHAWFATEWDRRYIPFATGGSGLRIARGLYGLAMIAFGLSHFAYLDFTVPLVPAWLPWHVGWAYFTGCAYLAAGAAVLAGVCARLAATLSALQMGMFLLLVWIPRAAAGRLSTFQWGELVVTCALTAAAWVVADSYRGTPWLSIRKSSSPMAHADTAAMVTRE